MPGGHAQAHRATIHRIDTFPMATGILQGAMDGGGPHIDIRKDAIAMQARSQHDHVAHAPLSLYTAFQSSRLHTNTSQRLVAL